ncbi:hypothetical protein ACFE04_014429 [Oxalis oulophora]
MTDDGATAKGKDRERESEKKSRDHRVKEKDRDRERDRSHKDRHKSTRHASVVADDYDNKESNKESSRTSKRTRFEDDSNSKRGKADNEEDVKVVEAFEDLDEGEIVETDSTGPTQPSASQLGERILKMKEERLKKSSEGASDILSWVSKSRKIEEKKKAERQRALHLSRIFEEQDNVNQEQSDDEEAAHRANHDLAGVKVLDGLDKVMEGGAVVLTLKDQSILADGDLNEDIDMLENVEIGEQKRRNEAYKAAKKKPGVYEDKFNVDPFSEKKMLPQYDDPIIDEGVALDARGRFTGEAEKKLEELRKRIQGTSVKTQLEDLNSSGKISSDYYTEEEMLKFKKPKKKKAKSLRKKDKLDLDALEAEALSLGLGTGDLGTRAEGKRKAIKEEEEKAEAEMRSKAYKLAYAKAEEASKSLRVEQTLPVKVEDEENRVVVDDDDDLYKSLEKARKLALKKQEEKPTGLQAIALLATSTASHKAANDQNKTTDEPNENEVVFTEMEEFVWGLQLNEEARVPDGENVFMEEDEPITTSEQPAIKQEASGWAEIKESEKDENQSNDDKVEINPENVIHESSIGKGLSGALRLLQDRGTLKETVDWGGRNMDKKKSKLVGIVDNNNSNNNEKAKYERFKDIRIERTDEFGRIMTPKEAFRVLSHKFHGKGPGKMKLEKRQKQYFEEQKLKQMKNSDTPSLSVARMREAQAELKTPYLVLSGHVKPGQTSDPKSGFATVEKDFPGGLTPMLGNSKVEQYLGIKRSAEDGNGNPSASKKPRT